MRITFNGAAQTVTGSQYFLEVNGQRLLLECGLYQGHRAETYINNQNFRFNPRSLDAVILSHAHIDHSGNLPNLVKHGYEGPIYTTKATARLAEVMLEDSGHIQEADAMYANQKRLRRGEPPIEPLYTIEDAKRVFPLFKRLNYRQTFEPVKGVTAQLVDAGHILGSASVILDVEENGRKFRVWFSGDIGRKDLPLVKDPTLPEKPDYMIMECTYGDKPKRDPEEGYAELRSVLVRTFARNGKVIIPAFAVGRTQELVYFINQMISAGDIPSIPVFVDSPLAVAASKVFKEFPEYFDAETAKFVLEGRHPALDFPNLTYTQSVEESKALNDRREPMVIISASGMAETGRILHHLRNNIENDRNTILIVSWQAPNTLGRLLAEQAPQVRIYGQLFDRRAEVVTIGTFSAHAGQDTLLDYVRAARPQLKKLYLIHGEPDKANALIDKLCAEHFCDITYPKLYDSVEI
ncbi:MAG TPA: MBL fold metallo-hydrolase [Longilinea sp.]|nr:MBL fold metallo-hydrolase [Longilinea sp.]